MDTSPWAPGQFIFGILLAAVGFVVVWKADWIMNNFGRIPFAEKYLSTDGGTRLFYKLLGILVMIVGMMHAVDLLQPVGAWFLTKFFGSFFQPGAGE